MKRFHFVGAFVLVISTVRTSKCLFVVLLNAKEGKDTILFRIACFYFVAYFWASQTQSLTPALISIVITLHHWSSHFRFLCFSFLLCFVESIFKPSRVFFKVNDLMMCQTWSILNNSCYYWLIYCSTDGCSNKFNWSILCLGCHHCADM